MEMLIEGLFLTSWRDTVAAGIWFAQPRNHGWIGGFVFRIGFSHLLVILLGIGNYETHWPRLLDSIHRDKLQMIEDRCIKRSESTTSHDWFVSTIANEICFNFCTWSGLGWDWMKKKHFMMFFSSKTSKPRYLIGGERRGLCDPLLSTMQSSSNRWFRISNKFQSLVGDFPLT